jgi:hypothetical protein
MQLFFSDYGLNSILFVFPYVVDVEQAESHCVLIPIYDERKN